MNVLVVKDLSDKNHDKGVKIRKMRKLQRALRVRK